MAQTGGLGVGAPLPLLWLSVVVMSRPRKVCGNQVVLLPGCETRGHDACGTTAERFHASSLIPFQQATFRQNPLWAWQSPPPLDGTLGMVFFLPKSRPANTPIAACPADQEVRSRVWVLITEGSCYPSRRSPQQTREQQRSMSSQDGVQHSIHLYPTVPDLPRKNAFVHAVDCAVSTKCGGIKYSLLSV